VLQTCPGVAEAAVVPVPNPVLGEEVGAFLVAHEGVSLDEAQVVDHCRTHLADYKVPVRIAVVPALPRNAMGRVTKGALRFDGATSGPSEARPGPARTLGQSRT